MQAERSTATGTPATSIILITLRGSLDGVDAYLMNANARWLVVDVLRAGVRLRDRGVGAVRAFRGSFATLHFIDTCG